MQRKILQTLKVWQHRATSRKSLRKHMLWSDTAVIERDLGMIPGSLTREAHKFFWQI